MNQSRPLSMRDATMPAGAPPEPHPEQSDILLRLCDELRADVRMLGDLPTWLLRDLAAGGAALTARAREDIDLMSGHVRRLDTVLRGMTHYGRAGRVPMGEAHNAKLILHDVLEELPDRARLTVRWRLPERRLRLRIHDIRQLFAIPVRNVLLHAPEATRLTLIGRVLAGQWVLYVHDDGAGLAPEARERAFEPLARCGAGGRWDGAGLGLATLRRIARAAGGDAGFLDPGRRGGTLLRVRLPLEPAT